AALLPPGTELPASRSRDDFELAADKQEYFELPVVEFEPGNDDQYEMVGNFRCRCLSGARRGDRVRVTFEYDVSGIPLVKAFDQRSGQPLVVDREMSYGDPDLEKLGTGVRPRWVVFAIDVSGSMMGAK